MADALELSPQRVLVELGDFASSFNGRRRWAPVGPGVSVRVAAARLARGAKWAAEYYVVRGKETVDTMEDFEVHMYDLRPVIFPPLEWPEIVPEGSSR